MADTETIRTTSAPQPVGAYPHAKRVGNLLFLSGIGPRPAGGGPIPGVTLDESGGVAAYDVAQQCHAVFANVRAVLESANASCHRTEVRCCSKKIIWEKKCSR